MKLETTSRFDREYARLPQHLRARVDKQLALLLSDPRHRSLRLKKTEGHPGVWEGRVTRGYRFTFTVEGDVYFLRRVGTHDILKRP